MSGVDPALAERQQVLRRTVRGLPGEMLDALVRGLERHGDELVAGRLFRSGARGGCAVGVMLRELEPETYGGGRVRFLLRHRWRRRAASYGGELARNPRLRHLEWSFDAAVKRTREVEPQRSSGEAARAVGAWLLAEARRELAWRALRGAGDAAPSHGGREARADVAV